MRKIDWTEGVACGVFAGGAPSYERVLAALKTAYREGQQSAINLMRNPCQYTINQAQSQTGASFDRVMYALRAAADAIEKEVAGE